MKYYLLDYENVNASGLDGISELSEDCKIVLFYTRNSNKIDLGIFNVLRNMKAEISIIEVHHGKQALDIQLASYLGYLIGTEPEDTEYYIISKDKGYRNVQSFWPERHIVLCRNLSPDSEIIDEPSPKKSSSKSGSRGGRKSSSAKAAAPAKKSEPAVAAEPEKASEPAKAAETQAGRGGHGGGGGGGAAQCYLHTDGASLFSYGFNYGGAGGLGSAGGQGGDGLIIVYYNPA